MISSLVERIMNGFEHQAPFVIAAGGIAVAAGGAGWPAPCEYTRERLSEKGLLACDCGHQRRGVDRILAHGGVAGVAGDGCAMLPANGISIFPRPQRHVILKRQRAAHVAASGSVIAEMRFHYAVDLGFE